MLTLLSQPASIALSRNQLVFKFEVTDGSGDAYGPIGVRSRVETSGASTFANDDTLVIDWTEPDGSTHSFTFTAKTTPTDDDHIPADISGYISLQEYFADVANHINANPIISPLFTSYMVSDSPNIYLYIETQEISNNWAVAFDISGITPPSFSTTDYDTITADNTPTNYKVFLDVFFESSFESGTFEKVVELDSEMDEDGIVTFNIENIIHSETKESLSNPPLPVFDNDELFLSDTLRRYYVRYREDYDGISPSWTTVDIKNIVCGGIAQNLFADFDFFTNLAANNSLLSWYPDGKYVSTDQPEYIHWYNYTGSTQNIVLEVKRYGASGLINSFYAFDTGSPIDIEDSKIISIPAGYDQLDINNTNCLKYTVRVVDASSDWEGGSPSYFSQERNYYVDYKYYEEKRYIQYLNGFCLPETMRCIGAFSNQLNVTREESRKILTPDYSSTFTEKFQHEEEFENRFTYRTGFLTRYEVDALQEAMIYNKIYEVYDYGYIPLFNEDKKFDIYDTLQDLFSIEFKATPALYGRTYSNLNIPLSDDQEGWALVAGDYWRTRFGLKWALS